MDREVQAALQAVIDEWQRGRPSPRVLEAGCGHMTHLSIPPGAHLTGIDIDPDQLARNDSVDELITGDLQTFPLAEANYDLVICWDVLEHLANPRAAMANLARAVAPGGLLLMAGPNVFSLKGAAAKLTPFSLHRLFLRSQRGRWCLPVSDLSRGGQLAPSCGSLGGRPGHLSVAFTRSNESRMQVEVRERLRWTGAWWSVFDRAVRGLTLGLFEPSATDFALLFKRPAPATAPGSGAHRAIAAQGQGVVPLSSS